MRSERPFPILAALVVGAGLLGAACATIPVATCSQLLCGGPSRCELAGEDMLSSGRPDAAICYFDRALAQRPGSAVARMGVASALAVTGRANKARTHFKWVAGNASDEDTRQTARDWLALLDHPTRVAFFVAPSDGCGDSDGALAAAVARTVRANLPRFAPFERAGDDVLDTAACERSASTIADCARRQGARLALVTRLTCRGLAEDSREKGDGGWNVTVGVVPRKAARVVLEIEAYSVATGDLGDVLTAEGEATSSISRDVAVLQAATRALADNIFRITSRLVLSK